MLGASRRRSKRIDLIALGIGENARPRQETHAFRRLD
jgi:hypothetical protein